MNTPSSTKAELSVPSTGHSIIAATTKKAKFQDTDNPRHLRVIPALLRKAPSQTEALSSTKGVSS